MKNVIRAVVIVLTLSGSAAYTELTLSSHAQPGVTVLAQTHVIPTCPPDDPNACGLRKH